MYASKAEPDYVVYCVKCKLKTDSVNVTEVTSKNNRRMLKAICSVCGKKKSQLVATSKNGNGISDIIGHIGELHLPASKGEYVPEGSFNNLNKYSYCGPGTKYEQRNKEGYKGINELDRMCKLHDKFYNENTDTASRNISDEALAHRASEIASDSRFDDEQRRFAKYVALIMKNKARFGFGISKKASVPSKREQDARQSLAPPKVEKVLKKSKNVMKGP